MPAQRKVFRIEESGYATAVDTIPVSAFEDEAALRHQELMSEIMALRALIGARPQPAPEPARGGLDQIAQARELKSELELIYDAIRRTKQEMSGLEAKTYMGQSMARVGRELDAVVAGTEQATQGILKAAEDIDQLASNMSSLIQGEYAQGLVQDMRDHVVKIFEACNFQDITGQRITKVVATLKFIENHIIRMREIWSSIEGSDPAASKAAPAQAVAKSDSKFLNGPKLAGDAGHSSQADIDLIFDSN